MNSSETVARKPYVGRDGQVSALSQLRLRPSEDREWAASLAATHSGKDAVVEIKSRLGIDLKWDSNYSRFLQCQQQQNRIEDYIESLQKRLEFAELRDPTAPETARPVHTALLMDEAVRNNDAKTFVGVARISLAETRVAQSAKKFELTRQRIDIQKKRLNWEIKKYNDIHSPRKTARWLFSSDEERDRVLKELYDDPPKSK